MIDFSSILRSAKKATSDNAPMMLTALGVTGLVTTAVLTGQATFKAAEILAKEKKEASESTGYDEYALNDKRMVELVWKLYIPAVGTGVISVVCIIAANRIHTRRAAALASAYSLSQRAFAEYKDKVIDKIGEKKEQEVRDEIAQDRVNKKAVTEVMIVGKGEVLCMDMHSGRYFMSDMETIRKAVNDINQQIIKSDYASLTDFYEQIGLPKTSESDEIGWSSDCLLEVAYATAISTDGRPCITIDFDKVPFRGYYVGIR